ncbi:ROK family transcriptional regulator [Fuerstiella marisgermanici]|uniref:N-acetylglucosamine repressor n=1 Tax=Fuerstiella marisgermanici TaxID=1891926 RepID=A0A1P8WJP1_9PLAN|nr:ROK family transcriptional regulator [Fuerstiella marisgermanici]APZ94268.1 N-acetylglucosamine repressor [Fuerstiella marisgermanici]
MASSDIQPGLLRKMTVRRVLECLQQLGPLSRADLTRETGISAPTVSKAVADLLDSGLLEEGAAPDNVLGRPGKRLQLAQDRAQVLGVVLDAGTCDVVAASLDGAIHQEMTTTFATPSRYDNLRQLMSDAVCDMIASSTATTLGIGISMPGLTDENAQRNLFSPNLHAINQQNPAADLFAATGVTAIAMQDARALCMAERLYGNARGLHDFAMLDVSTGLGLGVFSGGELLSGHNGFAGELGHITVDPTGKLCGCGNHGCLETLATDTALAAMISDRLGERLSAEVVIERLHNGELQAPQEVNRVCEYLAIAMASVINLFNPSNLLIHGGFPSISESILPQVIRMTQRRALAPSFERCEIKTAATTKQLAAIAAIVHHLTCAAGPRVSD